MFGLEVCAPFGNIMSSEEDRLKMIEEFHRSMGALESFCDDALRHSRAAAVLGKISTVVEEESQLSGASCALLNEGLCGLVPAFTPGCVTADQVLSVKAAVEGFIGDFWEGVKAFFKMLWDKITDFFKWLFGSSKENTETISNIKASVKEAKANPEVKAEWEAVLNEEHSNVMPFTDVRDYAKEVEAITEACIDAIDGALETAKATLAALKNERLAANDPKADIETLKPKTSSVTKPTEEAGVLVIPKAEPGVPSQLGWSIAVIDELATLIEKTNDPTKVEKLQQKMDELKRICEEIVDLGEKREQSIIKSNTLTEAQKKERIALIRGAVGDAKTSMAIMSKTTAKIGSALRHATHMLEQGYRGPRGRTKGKAGKGVSDTLNKYKK